MRLSYKVLLIVLILCFNCSENKKQPPFEDENKTMFTSIPESHSKIGFKNTVKENLYFNFLNYSYIYNGGGVAVGDINNDGLEDIYFTSNQESNKLYLNKENFVFEDITDNANVKDIEGWSTGVSMVDINNDGWLDIYVCKSGSLDNAAQRQNKLYVNQKDNTFREEASKYGLNQHGFSTQSYFFDFDKDGDLDMYLVNHRADFKNNIKINSTIQNQLTLEDSDHLFRNDNGTFVNITQQAGVANKAWGLSASIGDFNNDNWPDVYVANDFLEPDFLYINNQDGTFTDKSLNYFNHISFYSMGSDFADINNDLRPDLIVLDMMAADRRRGKENMATMSTENFNAMVKIGYHHQYSSNILQLNNGNGSFSEIGQLSGIAKTDWSWAPLVADFDNDGFNDVFVTNGIEHDLSNQDFRNKVKENIKASKKMTLEEAIALMPSAKLSNYMFLNNRDYTFKDVSSEFGFGEKVNSNGAAYADFDNDGDLDLVINNQGDKASIYRNNNASNYVSITLEGPENNTYGIGTKVEVFANDLQQLKEVNLSRGYQSSVSNNLIFGLGNNEEVDSIRVIWNNNKTQTLKSVKANRHLVFSIQDAKNIYINRSSKKPMLVEQDVTSLGINYKHQGVNFNDYEIQLLLPQKQSTIDNALAVGDVNNDGLDDFFIGNTMGYSGQLYFQDNSGNFIMSDNEIFELDKDFNDNNALFFDADNDGDLDLYVASGNYIQQENSDLLQDRLYLNDGKGEFSKGKLPKMLSVTKAVAADDFDADGDLDLFVGGRVIPGKYPNPPESYLLENRKGNFVNVISNNAPDLQKTGLVNDAIFSDFDNDGDKDLIIVGEWLPITVFDNDKGYFRKLDLESNTIKGWFQTIKAIDFDNDGDEDYFVGNYGKNNKFKPSEDVPLHIYANNFDDNDSYDTALGKESQGELFPIRGKECSSQQTPFLNEKIETFKEFANSNIVDIYGKESIDNALHLEATSFNSYYIQNNSGKFEFKKLPNEAQFGPTLDFEFTDFNNDSKMEVIGVGSIYDAEVETIRYDASKGYILNNMLNPDFGIQDFTNADIKAIQKINIRGEDQFLIFKANNELGLLKKN